MKKINLTLLLAAVLMLSLSSCELDLNTESQEKKEKATAQKEASTDTKEVSTDTKSSPSFISGLDLSRHQKREIDWLKTHSEQLSFVICKATEGITYQDPYFRDNWKTIPELGLTRGAYHFYRTKDAPVPQAKHYLSVINLQANDIPPIIDFEGASFKGSEAQSIQEIQDNILVFLKTVEEISNRKPIIYVNNDDANKYLDRAEFGAYAIWIADWSGSTDPVLPNAWRGKEWAFWQKTPYDKIDGRLNDYDIFNGDKEGLAAFIKSH